MKPDAPTSPPLTRVCQSAHPGAFGSAVSREAETELARFVTEIGDCVLRNLGNVGFTSPMGLYCEGTPKGWRAVPSSVWCDLASQPTRHT